MSIDEAPVDCFRVKCVITGLPDEISQQREEYLLRYPYMCYGTRNISTTEGGIVLQRFRTREICAEACIHTPVAKPLDTKQEEGKDHTVFQTNHTMRT
jgi:hypothetical protein